MAAWTGFLTSGHLRGTITDVAIVSAKECGFEEVGQSARSEERPVLSAFKIEVRVFAGGIIHAHVGQAQTEGIASQRRDVAVMRNAEVAFKVGFDPARKSQLRGRIRPLKVCAKTRATRLDVEFGVFRRASVLIPSG